MNRRTILKGGLVVAATAHTAAIAPEVPKPTPQELVRYHSDELMKALAQIHPDRRWLNIQDINLDSVWIIGKQRKTA